MYYIYDISNGNIVTRPILGGRATRPITGTKAEVTKAMATLKRNYRKANLVVISHSKAVAKGIVIPGIVVAA